MMHYRIKDWLQNNYSQYTTPNNMPTVYCSRV